MLFNPADAARYWIDTAQRSMLFLDTLRQRGNRTLEHYNAGKPPVLVFDFETVLDGADFERPCNYVLLRITPPKRSPTDPAKRPFVVFDPRAGHGPGISGSKEASQVGVALRAGHPVYFVIFFTNPDLEAAARALPADRAELCRSLVARDLWGVRQRVAAELRRRGALVVETPPGDAGVEAVNAYVDVKRRQLL